MPLPSTPPSGPTRVIQLHSVRFFFFRKRLGKKNTTTLGQNSLTLRTSDPWFTVCRLRHPSCRAFASWRRRTIGSSKNGCLWICYDLLMFLCVLLRATNRNIKSRFVGPEAHVQISNLTAEAWMSRSASSRLFLQERVSIGEAVRSDETQMFFKNPVDSACWYQRAIQGLK